MVYVLSPVPPEALKKESKGCLFVAIISQLGLLVNLGAVKGACATGSVQPVDIHMNKTSKKV